MPTDTQKLRVLRARTDSDLVVLVQRQLNRGFALVDAARSRQSPIFSQAEKAHATATVLLPRIFGLSEADRLRFESRLKELKAKLEQVPLYANVRPYPASVAS
jgi:hypothetical protein